MSLIAVSLGLSDVIFFVLLVVAVYRLCFRKSKKVVTNQVLDSSKINLDSNFTDEIEDVGVVKNLSIFPIKSCGGVELESAVVTRFGLRYDRYWMVVGAKENAQGVLNFLTQRQHPRLALVSVELNEKEKSLVITSPDVELPLCIDLLPNEKNKVSKVKVWDDTVMCEEVGELADHWFSACLDKKVKLVRIGAAFNRSSQNGFHCEDSDNACALHDDMPIHITSQKSMDKVSETAKEELSIRRFRSNIIVDTNTEAFDEDYWRGVNIGKEGNCLLNVIKGADRCKMPQINPDTAVAHKKEFPKKCLVDDLKHTTKKGEYMFGVKGVPIVKCLGAVIKVGDKITVNRRFGSKIYD